MYIINYFLLSYYTWNICILTANEIDKKESITPEEKFHLRGNNLRKKLKQDKLEVIPIEKNGRQFYKCGYETFATLEEANRYLQKKRQNIKWGQQNKQIFGKNEPPNHINKYKSPNHINKNDEVDGKKSDHFYNTLKKKCSFNKNDIECNLGSDTISRRIWKFVWKNCYFIECFSPNRYAPLMGKYIDEINLYRKYHGSRPLQYDNRLTKIAQERAQLDALSFSIKNHPPSEYFGENFGTIIISLAPLLMKKWYDKNIKYNYKTFAPLPGTENFSNMIWKSSRSIGIGIAVSQGKIFVTVLFSEKGNVNFKFRENVLKPLLNKRNFNMQ